jgi:hypothetical protein
LMLARADLLLESIHLSLGSQDFVAPAADEKTAFAGR